MEKKQCEVNIHFRVPKEKSKHIFRATSELAKAGIHFDTGGPVGTKNFEYDWEFDWSLCGGVEVIFRKFKDDEAKNSGVGAKRAHVLPCSPFKDEEGNWLWEKCELVKGELSTTKLEE